jgi:hypothetical protein
LAEGKEGATGSTQRVDRPVWLLLVVLAVTICSTACSVSVRVGGRSAEVGPQAGDGHYANDAIGFSFDYPPAWNEITGGLRYDARAGDVDTIAQIALGDLDGTGNVLGLIVEINRLSPALADRELTRIFADINSVIAQLAGNVGGELTSSADTTLDDHPARRYRIEYMLDGIRTVNVITTTVRDRSQFVLNCQFREFESDEVLRGCEQAVDSFRFD